MGSIGALSIAYLANPDAEKSEWRAQALPTAAEGQDNAPQAGGIRQ